MLQTRRPELLQYVEAVRPGLDSGHKALCSSAHCAATEPRSTQTSLSRHAAVNTSTTTTRTRTCGHSLMMILSIILWCKVVGWGWGRSASSKLLISESSCHFYLFSSNLLAPRWCNYCKQIVFESNEEDVQTTDNVDLCSLLP